MNSRRAPILIFTYGNPSRGDDALGPAMFDLLGKWQQENCKEDEIELQTDFQLQIEHAMDLEGRKKILFVDASVSCAAPFECQRLQARQDDSFTTHAMSPSSVLAVYKQINHHQPPPAWLLTIRGYEFDLGLDMSEQARDNLRQAYQYILENYCK
ncbi:MAG: hydrogenase maturation protease [Proteobacteria bacterium]|nr:hydrogenase maturation protease [Pseudomonadota bacterium]